MILVIRIEGLLPLFIGSQLTLAQFIIQDALCPILNEDLSTCKEFKDEISLPESFEIDVESVKRSPNKHCLIIIPGKKITWNQAQKNCGKSKNGRLGWLSDQKHAKYIFDRVVPRELDREAVSIGVGLWSPDLSIESGTWQCPANLSLNSVFNGAAEKTSDSPKAHANIVEINGTVTLTFGQKSSHFLCEIAILQSEVKQSWSITQPGTKPESDTQNTPKPDDIQNSHGNEAENDDGPPSAFIIAASFVGLGVVFLLGVILWAFKEKKKMRGCP